MDARCPTVRRTGRCAKSRAAPVTLNVRPPPSHDYKEDSVISEKTGPKSKVGVVGIG
jgi:hypothetical protein